LVACLLAMPAFSAGTLSWEDCRKAALEHDPDYLAAKSSAGAAKASYGGSIAGLLPVNLSNKYRKVWNQSQNPDNRWNSSLTANADLFSFSDGMSVWRASAALVAAHASLRASSASVRQAVRTAFADLIYAQELMRISEEIAAIRGRNAKLVALRYDSGRAALGDKLQVEAQQIEAMANVSQAKRNLLTARMSLARHIGLTASAYGPAATGELSIADPPASPPDSSVLLDSIPAVQIARAKASQARASLFEVPGRLLPIVSASYTWDRPGPTLLPDGPISWSAVGSLSLPDFRGVLSFPFEWIAAGKQTTQAEEAARSRELSAAQDLQSSWASYAAAADSVVVQEAYLKATDQRNRESDIMYTSGRMAFENWQQIVTEFVNFKRSSLRTRRDAFVAEAGWHETLGRGLEEP
jgi:outer membrane protein TolC